MSVRISIILCVQFSIAGVVAVVRARSEQLPGEEKSRRLPARQPRRRPRRHLVADWVPCVHAADAYGHESRFVKDNGFGYPLMQSSGDSRHFLQKRELE